MARQSYGTTPWGAWFLEMLKAYDDSGRLSRGKTYANTGKVNSLVVNGQTAGAKVKGNYVPWYHVYFKFPPLSKTNENAIRSILEKHPIELAGLRAGIMSPALIEALKKKKVRLIPARWNLIERDCTCPDSGDPCKHMAAVLFLLAKEIDHDPRLLFKLAGFDLDSVNIPEGAASKNAGPEKERNFTLLQEHPVPLSLRKNETLTEASLTSDSSGNREAASPPELTAPLKFSLGESYLPLISGILPPEPNFTSSDFIIKLTEFYHKAVLNYGLNFYSQEKQGEKEKSVNPFLFARVKINIDNIRKQKRIFPLEPKSPLTVSIKLGENQEINQTLLQAQNFYKTRSSLNEMSPSVKILFSLFAIAGKLIQSSALIPAVFTENKKLFIFWKSLSASSEIKADILKFAASLTKDFFLPVEKWGRLYCAELLLTALLTEYAASLKFFPSKSYTKDKEIDSLFFSNEGIDISVPGKRNLDTVIYSWLSVLNYSNCGYEYRLTLDSLKEDEFFLLSALVRKAKENSGESTSFESDASSFSLEAEAPFTELNIAAKRSKNPDDILRFPASLSAYLPALSILAVKKNIMLSREEAGLFLQRAAKLLQRFGIDIVLPKSLKNVLTPKPVISVKSVKGAGNVVSFLNLDDVLSYDRAVMLGDTVIDIDEFKKLFLNKSGLVKFNDQFLLLDPEEVAKMLKAFEKPADMREALQAVLSGNAVCSKPAAEIIDGIFRQDDIPVPQNLNAELRPYQEKGFRWLYANIKSGFGCLLADDMGLGKTVQIISLILAFKNSKEAEEPFLVIAPASLLSNWEHEIAKFAPSLKVAVYHGARRKFNTEADVIISTYQTMQKDIEKLKDKKVFCIILDEAQAIKNSGTKKAHAVKAIQAKGRIALTGTPVENNLEDMRSIFDFFLPGYLGSADEFRKKWRIPIELHNSEIEADDLKKITSPFLLRRLKTDPKVISDLPDKIITNQYCNLTPEQLAIYENLVETELHKVMGAETKIERQAYVLKLLTALKQVCNHPRAYDKETPSEMKHSGKVTALIELLSEIISSGEKAIIFSQYVGTLDILKTVIQKELGTEALLLHGQMPASKRKKAVEVFQTDPAYRIFLISLKAGGTGLNLTAANRVIHFDLWYNPAVEDQATDRAFRIGQTKNVFVHRFICSGTFEEKVDEMIQKKREISGMSISSGETWISKLSNEELAGLFKK
ncbi:MULTISPECIES: DEAD/DEAH box helicase [unclassified Treponema]|uniref:DEAD/DEAH box helicase n=1 Tax=unclassified Treponema TaxID=2638727 RepID=UPI0020A4025F|nr:MULTISPECIES: DEAD/DEAH box helicase [unclassified Treponema]UTC67050.1 DEAD/DEAH box helicase family protein [Treponema sp. OMZ 789]UTC69781.1 DEAD/DEAH box helicase family protein [Treponema sp. OMZ 790]UTC72495.1 DEAD/DEAH box helicase family protein [Treponema sp. OMZ 791]